MRDTLQESIKTLKMAPGQVLHGRFVSTDESLSDLDNVLFYNVGPGCFKGVATQGLSFERMFARPPDPPVALSGPSNYYHHYQVLDDPAGFRDWDPVTLVCRWRANPFKLRGELSLTTHVWYHVKSGELRTSVSATDFNGRFGISMKISVPFGQSPLNLAGLAKPLIDGLLCALHVHDGKKLDELTERRSRELSVPASEVKDLLLDNRNALLGKRSLVRWHPADDQCVAGEILVETNVERDNWGLSGTLFEVKPKDPPLSTAL